MVGADEAAELLGDGEGDHEVVHGQNLFELLFKPFVGFTFLADGAVAVAAGAVDPMQVAAFFAVVCVLPIASGAACADGAEDFFMIRGHTIAVA